MMNDKEERLETALLEFVERVAKEPRDYAETEAMPEAARMLLRLWGIKD